MGTVRRSWDGSRVTSQLDADDLHQVAQLLGSVAETAAGEEDHAKLCSDGLEVLLGAALLDDEVVPLFERTVRSLWQEPSASWLPNPRMETLRPRDPSPGAAREELWRRLIASAPGAWRPTITTWLLPDLAWLPDLLPAVSTWLEDPPFLTGQPRQDLALHHEVLRILAQLSTDRLDSGRVPSAAERVQLEQLEQALTSTLIADYWRMISELAREVVPDEVGRPDRRRLLLELVVSAQARKPPRAPRSSRASSSRASNSRTSSSRTPSSRTSSSREGSTESYEQVFQKLPYAQVRWALWQGVFSYARAGGGGLLSTLRIPHVLARVPEDDAAFTFVGALLAAAVPGGDTRRQASREFYHELVVRLTDLGDRDSAVLLVAAALRMDATAQELTRYDLTGSWRNLSPGLEREIAQQVPEVVCGSLRPGAVRAVPATCDRGARSARVRACGGVRLATRREPGRAPRYRFRCAPGDSEGPDRGHRDAFVE